MAAVGVAGEEHVEMEEEKFLKRQEAVFAVFAGQRHKAGNLLGDGQKRLERAVIGFALQLQGQRKAGVGDEGEGMGWVNREGREHGKDVAQEVVFEKLQVAPGEFGAGGDQDAFGLHLAAQALEHRLLHLHQVAGIGVNEGQLFGGAEAIFGGGGIARLHQRAQACDADGVKLIEVGGRDGQEPQPFQKRHGGVGRLFQNAPVEGQPRDFAVEKAARAGGFLGRKDNRLGEGGFEEISVGHGRQLPRDYVIQVTVFHP